MSGIAGVSGSGICRKLHFLSFLTIMRPNLIILKVYKTMENIYSSMSPELVEEILNALASVYISMIDVDFQTGKLYPITLPPEVMSYMANAKDYRSVVPLFVSQSVSKDFRSAVQKFMDPDTIEDRLSSTGVLTTNYIGEKLGWLRIRFIPSQVDSNGRVLHAVFCTQDINKEKEQEREMNYLVEHDPLTRVYNRTAFLRLSSHMKADAAPFTFLMIDVDSFKKCNDTYGHTMGDRVLARVSSLLVNFFRASDFVFRMGGDEFAMFLPGCSRERGAVAVINKINQINSSLMHPQRDLPPVSLSVGMSFSPAGYQDRLYSEADMALYDAKRLGGGQCRIFAQETIQMEDQSSL